MILHLLNESNFDSLIINQMEECCPGENLILFFPGSRSVNVSESVYKGETIFEKDFKAINFSKIDGVIIHFLSIPKAKLLRKIPRNIPIACSFWGADFYEFVPELRDELYGTVTKKFLNQKRRFPLIYYVLKQHIFSLISGEYRLWMKSAKRIKVYSTVIPTEKGLIEKYVSSDAKYLQIPTNSLEKVINIDHVENSISTKEKYLNKILIGNSGNPTNNHLEIFSFIKNLRSENISIQVPLTYGNKEYIKYICETGKSLFGSKFFPLLEHKTATDFYNFIDCFNIFIFNSFRQQGIGTIVLALWSGGKVFLSNKNLTASFYRESGMKIFSIEKDLFLSDETDLFKPLTVEEILLNRQLLLKLYSKKIVNDSIAEFIEKLKE